MTTARELLNHLQKASNQGLVYVAFRSKKLAVGDTVEITFRSKKLAAGDTVEITFTDTVTTKARDTLAQHIQRHYNVQAWWVNKDKLHVQDYVR